MNRWKDEIDYICKLDMPIDVRTNMLRKLQNDAMISLRAINTAIQKIAEEKR